MRPPGYPIGLFCFEIENGQTAKEKITQVNLHNNGTNHYRKGGKMA